MEGEVIPMNPENIRSAQFIDTYFPVVDGVVNTVHNYATLMNRTSYCCVVCPQEKGKFDDATLPYDVIRAASLRLPISNYAAAWPKNPALVQRVLEKAPLDIIHVHSPLVIRGSAVQSAKKLGIPLVATFHSKYYDDFLQVTKSKTLARHLTDWIVKFYDQCDAVWTCSESTAETLRSYGYQKEISIIQNGTDLVYPKNASYLRKKAMHCLHMQQDRKTLLFVGSLFWKKNIRLILETFRILCDEDASAYRLILVGDGDEGKEIRAFAKSLGFDKEQLIFTGHIGSRDFLSGLFLASDLFFFPSLYDNAPLVLREAAALGVPALLAEGSCASEVIRPEVNGYLEKADQRLMAQKIRRIFSDPAKRKETGERAKETIPLLWEKIIPMVYEKYAEVIGRK